MELMRGTLDLLILKTVSLGGNIHGYAIATAIRDSTRDVLQVQEGVLYPALRKLERQGLLDSEWGYTETGREARFYELTRAGRAALRQQEREWNDYVQAMRLALRQA
jgi:transcriptional regulator